MRWVFAFYPRAILSLLLSVLVTVAVQAQFKAGIQGTVTDTAGAAIAGATVTLSNKETNRTQQIKSGEGGFYRFDRLPPGEYTLTVAMSGFKKQLLANVNVRAEELQGVNVVLETGDVSETITVSSQAEEQIEIENANVDRSITTREILRLPQIGRDPYELARLTPGVFGLGARAGNGDSIRLPNSPGPGGSNSSIYQTENQLPISANGQRLTANAFEIDGVSVNSQVWGGAAVLTPNQESVKEVRVVSTSYSAENGRNSGALIQVVSKNGTNEFHGSAVFKYNDPSLNAFNRWGGSSGGAPVRTEKRTRQWAGSIGGPIYFPRFGQGGSSYWSGKNRLFFFFSLEGASNNSNRFEDKWIETPEYRQLIQTQRAGSLASRIVGRPGTEQPVQNLLSRSCADVGVTDPNRCATLPGGLDIGGLAGTTPGQSVSDVLGGGLDGVPDIRFARVISPSTNTARQFNTRIDYQATSSDLVAFSLYYTPNDTRSFLNGRPAHEILSARRNTAGALLWNHTLSPTMLNEARFNVTRWYFDEITSNPDLPFGIPRVIVNTYPFNTNEIDWGQGGVGVFYQTAYSFRDVLSKVVGSHGLKFGVEIAKDQNNDTLAGGARPEYRFGTLWNFANDAPIQESGNFDPRTGVPTEAKKYIRSTTYSLFAQDDWKVRPNLTLNLGLRWEYFSPLKEKFGNLSKLVLGSGQNALNDARLVVGEPLHEPDRNNFGPQIGFAWSPHRFRNKAVLRGGFGVGYNRIPLSVTLNGRENLPLINNFTLIGDDILYTFGPGINSFTGYPANPNAVLQFDPNTNLPIGGTPPNVFATQQDVPNPYTYRYSLDVQYEVGKYWLASLGYQGSTGRKFPRVVYYTLFAPTDRLNRVRVMLTDANSNYNAMLARLSRRFSNGLNLDVQYRWSKSIDTCSNDDDCHQTYAIDQRTERGPSDYDARHYFMASGLWELPILRGRRDFAGKAFGGWQLNGILTTASGFPWTPVYRADDCDLLMQRGLCPLRPIAYNGNLTQETSNEAFLRPGGSLGPGAAQSFVPPPDNITVPPPPAIGRNTFRGPHYFGVDMSVIKRVGLPGFFGEAAGLDVRANFFNIFNNLNLKPFDPNTESTRINNVDFGRAREALSGRVIEFQVRFSF